MPHAHLVVSTDLELAVHAGLSGLCAGRETVRDERAGSGEGVEASGWVLVVLAVL